MMNDNKINLINIFLLTFIITGAITFLLAIFYWDKDILLLSLIQLMGGSAGYYMIQKNCKTPL